MTSKARIDAVEAISAEFMAFAMRANPVSVDEARGRYDRINKMVQDSGGLDAWSVYRLFEKLETKALNALRDVAALAQSLEPDDLRRFSIKHTAAPKIVNGMLVKQLDFHDERELPDALVLAALKRRDGDFREGQRRQSAKGGSNGAGQLSKNWDFIKDKMVATWNGSNDELCQAVMNKFTGISRYSLPAAFIKMRKELGIPRKRGRTKKIK